MGHCAGRCAQREREGMREGGNKRMVNSYKVCDSDIHMQRNPHWHLELCIGFLCNWLQKTGACIDKSMDNESDPTVN